MVLVLLAVAHMAGAANVTFAELFKNSARYQMFRLPEHEQYRRGCSIHTTIARVKLTTSASPS